jgi:hypothetical protein
MRDDRQRLLDILEAAKLLVTFRAGKNRADLTHDLLLQSGFLHHCMSLAKRPLDFRLPSNAAFPTSPGTRFQDSGTISRTNIFLSIWQTVIADVPLLETQIGEILRAEAPGLFQDPSPSDS